MVRNNVSTRAGERGVALIAALLSLMILSALALGMMYSANMETDINTNFRDSIRADYAARAGVEEIRSRMSIAAGQTGALTLPAVMPAAGAGVLYVLNPRAGEAITPWSSTSAFFDTELCQESYFANLSSPGAGVSCTSVPSGTAWRTTGASVDPGTGTDNAMDYKWVRVTLKGNGSAAPYYVNNSSASGTMATRVCWDSSNKRQVPLPGGFATCIAANPNYRPVYVLTSLAVTQSGSRRMSQEEVTQLSLPPLPSALTLTGTPTYGAPSSNPFHVEGNDHADSACGGVTGAAVNAIGVTSDAADTAVSNAIPTNRRDNYTGLGGEEPNVANIASSMGTLGTTTGLITLTNTVKSIADVKYTGSQSGISIGTSSSPKVTFVDGNLTLSGNTSGAGILFVTGTLSTAGNFAFKGIIFVVGDGVWNSNGGGNGQLDGGAFIANIYSSTTHSSASLRGTPSNGAVTMDWDGGGGNGIYYNTCWINKVSTGLGFTTLSMRQLPY